jgi:hypothetical protein
MLSRAAVCALGAVVAMLHGTALAGPSLPRDSNSVTISPVQQIDYRRCWTSDGKRHCRLVRSNGGSRNDNAIPTYGAGRADNYRMGTAEWYRAMERDGRLSTEGGSP